MSTRERQVHAGADQRVPPQSPQWAGGNSHDPGLTLLALFGFVAASLLWRLSRPQENTALGLSRVLGSGLCAACAAWLLRRQRCKQCSKQ